MCTNTAFIEVWFIALQAVRHGVESAAGVTGAVGWVTAAVAGVALVPVGVVPEDVADRADGLEVGRGVVGRELVDVHQVVVAGVVVRGRVVGVVVVVAVRLGAVALVAVRLGGAVAVVGERLVAVVAHPAVQEVRVENVGLRLEVELGHAVGTVEVLLVGGGVGRGGEAVLLHARPVGDVGLGADRPPARQQHHDHHHRQQQATDTPSNNNKQRERF